MTTLDATRRGGRPQVRRAWAVALTAAMVVMLAACGSKAATATSTPTSGSDPSTTSTSNSSTTTTGGAGSNGPGVAITEANVCSFIDVSAAETASGVTGLTATATTANEGQSLICKLAAPGDPVDAYGTVNLIYDTSSPVSYGSTLEGLPGGQVEEPTAEGLALEAQHPGSGRGQTTASWVYDRYPISVNGRGPAVSTASMLALAQAVNAKLS